MKKFLIPIIFVFVTKSYSQEIDSELFQTWYLYTFQSSDISDVYTVSELEPQIAPTFTITEDLAFSGIGACNSYEGTFELVEEVVLVYNTFSNTEMVCGSDENITFENSYFEHFSEGTELVFTIYENETALALSTGIGGVAYYRNYPLNVKKSEINTIKVYPIPSSNFVLIEANNTIINKIELFDIKGKNVMIVSENFNSLDISKLPSGLYILKLQSDQGFQITQILKN